MIEPARADAVMYANKFCGFQGRVVESESGVGFDVFMDDLLKNKQHWRPAVYADEELLTFGEGTSLLKRGQYLKAHGEEKFNFEMQRWGCSPLNLKPGTRPAVATDKTTKHEVTFDEDHRANPFLHLVKRDGTRDQKAQEKITSMIVAMATKKVAAIAASCGKTITGLPLAR
jgi:hypothetical protein